MLTWVIYDISKDRTRSKIADRCLDFGLQRVQKSVYLGDLQPNRVDEVIEFSRELLDLETDSVYVFPMCQRGLRQSPHRRPKLRPRTGGRRGADEDHLEKRALTKNGTNVYFVCTAKTNYSTPVTFSSSKRRV